MTRSRPTEVAVGSCPALPRGLAGANRRQRVLCQHHGRVSTRQSMGGQKGKDLEPIRDGLGREAYRA